MEERLKHLSPVERAQMLPGPEDFDPDGARPAQDSAAIFKDLVGCGQVRPPFLSLCALSSLDPTLGSVLPFCSCGSWPFCRFLSPDTTEEVEVEQTPWTRPLADTHCRYRCWRSCVSGRIRSQSARPWARTLLQALSSTSALWALQVCSGPLPRCMLAAHAVWMILSLNSFVCSLYGFR